MADESTGGAPKKLSTKDILAAARAQAAKSAGAPAAASHAEPPAAPIAEAPPAAAPKPAATAGAKPKTTAEILAAARAQKAAAGDAALTDATPAPAKPAPASKGAPAGKPKSTAEILAAARAGKAGSAAAAAVSPGPAKPVAKGKPAPQAPAAEAPAGGTGLSVQEMLAAVRPASASVTKVAEPAALAKVAAPPPMPVRPAPAAKKGAPQEPRRFFLWVLLLSPFALAWSAFAAATAIMVLGTARFMLPNVLTEPPRKFKIGSPADFDLGTVATKLVAQYGIWIVHTDQYKGKNQIYALASVCTHLGCTPSWLEGEQKFKCPCHGSGFYITGINFEGPAPRPLERVGIRLSEDGMLEVDKSLKFQEEMGQWNDPASFYEVVG
ncbi:MAG: ubiquinol-cytochrome c reductase iron-sulfur subunit [Planctomycetales bacterium]